MLFLQGQLKNIDKASKVKVQSHRDERHETAFQNRPSRNTRKIMA